MKRYTLKVQRLDDSITQADIKRALEDILLRAQPSLIYRLGNIAQVDAGHFLVEIASDAKKDFLQSQFHILESTLAVKIKELGWGWVVAEGQNTPANSIPTPFQLEKKSQLVRYALLVLLPFSLIPLVIFRHRPVPGQADPFELVIFLIYIIWFFLLDDTPLDFRIHAKQIECLPAELVVTYWFRREAIHLRWEDIWGMEMKSRICYIYNHLKPVRFHIRSGLGPVNTEAVIRTITGKASLNNVETGISRILFKKYEAP